MQSTRQRRITGSVFTIKRRRGDQWYVKLRAPDPARPGRVKQTKRLLGPAWKDRGRPPAGYYTRKLAEQELQAMLTDARRGTLAIVTGTGRTLRDACNEWFAYLETERGRHPATLKDYRWAVDRYIVPEFGGDTRLADITTEQVDGLRERLLREGNLSRRSVQKIMILLFGICKRAKRRKWIPANPCDDAERVTLRPSGHFNALTVEEVYAIARAADDTMMAAIIVTAAMTGLRMGELRALRWRDIDFASRTVHVRENFVGGRLGRPKSGKVRSVPLADQVAVELDGLSRREDFTLPGDLVFPSVTGVHVDDKDVRAAFYAALAAAGMAHRREGDDPIVFHDLRHTFGTLCASNGIPVGDIQTYMGHSDVKTTQIYMHHAPKHDAAEKLTAAFAPTAETGSRPVAKPSV
jgi:integrase